MKLAEALQERADLNKKISQIGERLADNCFVQEGERPAEEPARLLDELEAAVSRLELLIAAINATNNVTKVNGRTLTETIARKDCLILRINTLEQLISKASTSVTRYTRREIKLMRTVDVSALRERTDALAKELRLLDNSLQEANWQTELVL